MYHTQDSQCPYIVMQPSVGVAAGLLACLTHSSSDSLLYLYVGLCIKNNLYLYQIHIGVFFFKSFLNNH